MSTRAANRIRALKRNKNACPASEDAAEGADGDPRELRNDKRAKIGATREVCARVDVRDIGPRMTTPSPPLYTPSVEVVAAKMP
jgi:hypothetical protein